MSGFPTLKFFPKENKEGEPYNGGRTLGDFVEYLNARCETDRLEDGNYGPSAGVVASLDDDVDQFMSADAEKKPDLLKKTQETIESLQGIDKSHGLYYTKVMEKVIEKGNEFVSIEFNRLARMISGGQLSAAKIDSFMKRQNVLARFND